MLPVLLFLAAQQIDPPTTVNGEVLGTAEQYATPGPGRVCIGSVSVDLISGETAYLNYLGIHSGGLRISTPRGTFDVSVSGSWADPGEPNRWVSDWRGRTIGRYRKHGRPSYMIFEPVEELGEERPWVRIEGNALGKSHDMDILNRILVNRGKILGCRREFEYGWEFEVEEE
jgi:hypothetical protein